MANNPSVKSPEVRFIGLDLGNSAARLSKTAYNLEVDRFQEPEIRTFEGSAFIPSLVISSLDGNQTITKRRDLPKLALHLDGIRAVEKDFIWRLENNPTETVAEQGIKAIADRLYKEAKLWLRFTDFEPDRYLVTMGVPSDWGVQSAAAQAFQSVLHQAGFTGTKVIPDAVAAVNFHLHSPKNQLPYHKDKTQTWLVIDVGGKSTHFTCVKKLAETFEVQVKGTFRCDWGGGLIDEKLYESFLLPKYWHSAEKPDEKQKSFLLQMICELKEKFSSQVNRSGVTSINFQLEGIQDPVELSKDVFESKDVCMPLIQQFKNLLDDPRLKTDPGFQGVDQVVLVGGGANWYFVQEAVNYAWPERCVYAQEPDQTIVKGLALARTGFEPPETMEMESEHPEPDEPEPIEVVELPPPVITPRANTNGRQGPDKRYPIVGYLKLGQQSTVHGRNEAGTWWCIQNPIKPGEYFWVTAETTQVTGDASQVRIIKPQARPMEKANKPAGDKHKLARQLILWCALGGAGIALLVSPIPGASWPFLMGLEIFMFLRIAVSYYGYKITSSTVILLVIGLLVISTILTLVVGELIGTLAWMIGMGWLIKSVVAGLVVWGLGEGAIYVLDKIAASEQPVE